MTFTVNQLAKEIKRTYIPAQAGSPGDPGQPYRPAQWVKRRVRECGYSYTTELGSGGGGLGTIGGTGGSAPTGYGPTTYNCKMVTRTIFVPEQPERPAIPPRKPTKEQTIIDYQLGWSGKAHSVEAMEGNGMFQFRVPKATTGAVVGLSASPRDKGYNDIAFGFYVESGVVKILESGQQVASLGAFPGSTLRISRFNGRIIYDIDGAVVRDRPNDPAPLFLSAALYTGGDTVDDAQLLPVNAASGAFVPLVGYAGDALPSQAIGYFPVMTGTAGSYASGGAIGSFLPMVGVAADASGYAVASGSFLPMTGEAESSTLAPSYAFADGEMMPMTGAAQGVMHIVGSAEGAFLPMIGLSSQGTYAQAIGFFEPMRGYADATEGTDQAMIFSAMTPADSIEAVSLLFAVIDSNMTLTGVFSVSTTNVAEILSALELSDTYSLAQTLRATIESWMEANASAFDQGASSVRDVWVYHMDASGSTRYEGFDFTGFAKVAGVYYGLKADGIYRLEGEDDDGAQVVGRINFGNLNFGTMARKALPYVYVGMASNGNTYLKVTADGQTYTYRVRDNTELMKAHRFELGRGLRASFYELELVADGTVFDLHSIEFQPVELTRRL